jgi:hypothetical protein
MVTQNETKSPELPRISGKGRAAFEVLPPWVADAFFEQDIVGFYVDKLPSKNVNLSFLFAPGFTVSLDLGQNAVREIVNQLQAALASDAPRAN